MWPFRRSRGRHELGAAVTSIPAYAPPAIPTTPAPQVVAEAVTMPPLLAPPPVAPEPVLSAPVVPVQVVSEPVALEPVALEPVATVAPPASGPAVPRVELGFRDGSTAALAPSSEQAKALSDLASVLTQRD